MKKTISAMLAVAMFTVGGQGMVSAAPALTMGIDAPQAVMLDYDEEDVTIVEEEPVESDDVLEDEDGDVEGVEEVEEVE